MCFAFDIEYLTWANPASMLVHLPYGQVKFQFVPRTQDTNADADPQPMVAMPPVAEDLEVA
jgi:hypothetical protein